MQGLWLMIIAMQVAPTIDAFAKLAIARVPALEIAAGRFVVQTVLSLALILLFGKGAELRPPRLRLHVMRGLMLATTTLLFFSALKVMPIVDALATAFVEPMILTALSALVLKEKVGPRRWLACFVGFIGCLIVVRPSMDVFGWHALLPLGSAVSFAFYHLITRQLAGHGSMLGSQFITGLTGASALLLVLLVTSTQGLAGQVAVLPLPMDALFITGVGIASLISHGLVLHAFQRAPAMVLAPLGYLEIISGTAYGYFIFGDFPHPVTWIGIAIIISSGLYILHRERIRSGRP